MADDSVMTLKSASGGIPADFSYRGMKSYHVTLPSFQKRPLFADRGIIPHVLNALRDSALAFHFDVILYTFLPDQLVLLVHGRTEESDMKAFLATFRTSAAEAVKTAAGQRLWKRTYLERVLRRGERPEHCVREIAALPVRAGLAAWPGGYEFTGSFVTDVAKLVELRRPAVRVRAEGRQFRDARRPVEGRRAPDRRRGPESGRPPKGPGRPEDRRGPQGRRDFEGGARPSGFPPRQARRVPGGGRPPDASRGSGGRRGPGGRRPPSGRRPGFKPGPGRSGGRPPTSPRGRPRR